MNDNNLCYLEAIHNFVEVLNEYFHNVCELDLVFNFYKVYTVVDEMFLAGEIRETSQTKVLKRKFCKSNLIVHNLISIYYFRTTDTKLIRLKNERSSRKLYNYSSTIAIFLIISTRFNFLALSYCNYITYENCVRSLI